LVNIDSSASLTYFKEEIEEAKRVLETRSNNRKNRTFTVRKNNSSGDADADYDFRNRVTLLKRKDSLNWPVHEDDLVFGESHVENLKVKIFRKILKSQQIRTGN
jgi:site-specific recombinase XerD